MGGGELNLELDPLGIADPVAHCHLYRTALAPRVLGAKKIFFCLPEFPDSPVVLARGLLPPSLDRFAVWAGAERKLKQLLLNAGGAQRIVLANRQLGGIEVVYEGKVGGGGSEIHDQNRLADLRLGQLSPLLHSDEGGPRLRDEHRLHP